MSGPIPDDREPNGLHPDDQPPPTGEPTSPSTPTTEPPKAANGHDPQAEIDRLAAQPELDYDRIDETTKAATAKTLGLKNAAALDRAVGRARKAAREKADDEKKKADKAAKDKARADKAAEAEAKDKAKQTPPLTKAEIDAELEKLALLDPDEYYTIHVRNEAKKRLGFAKVGMLDDRVKQIRQERLRKIPPPPKTPVPDTPEVTALIDEFNKLYFVLREHGTAIIYAEKFDPILNRRFYERITFADLDKLYLNRTVLTGYDKDGEPIYQRVAHVWLHHRNRKQFIIGMVFDPSGRQPPDGVFNLWRGFGVTPRQGSWDKLASHIEAVICNNDPDHFYYVLDWMADMFQNPAKQGEVAIVLRSEGEGTGKSILLRTLRHLCGQHGLVISNAKHLTGTFNAHQRDCIFLGADEALFAGDRSHVGTMKSIITEPFLVVEPKFRDAAQSPNYLHLMMCSNETWVVPASLRSRRWLVLDVNDSHANDHPYFKAIQDELDHGGYEAMLYELLHRDISQSNLRDVPVTKALITQRTLSLDTTSAWWLDCLMRGYVFASQLGLEADLHVWIDPVSTELLYASYERFARSHHERRPLNRAHFGTWLRENAGGKPFRPAAGTKVIVGEHITDATTTGSNYSSRVAKPVIRTDRPYSYDIGTLAKARDAFTKATKLVIEWPDDDPTAP